MPKLLHFYRRHLHKSSSFRPGGVAHSPQWKVCFSVQKMVKVCARKPKMPVKYPLRKRVLFYFWVFERRPSPFPEQRNRLFIVDYVPPHQGGSSDSCEGVFCRSVIILAWSAVTPMYTHTQNKVTQRSQPSEVVPAAGLDSPVVLYTEDS